MHGHHLSTYSPDRHAYRLVDVRRQRVPDKVFAGSHCRVVKLTRQSVCLYAANFFRVLHLLASARLLVMYISICICPAIAGPVGLYTR